MKQATEITGTPPHDPDAEQVVIGGVLLAAQQGDAEIVARTLGVLSEHDFYLNQHRQAWRAIEAVHGKGRQPDLVTVTDALRDVGTLDDAGGAAYLTGLLESVFSPSLLPQHVEIVKRHSARRQLADAAATVRHAALNGHSTEELTAVLARVAREFDSTTIRESSWRNRIQTAAELQADPGSVQTWLPLWGQEGFIGPGLLTLVSGHSKVAGKSTSLSVAVRDLLRGTPQARVLVLSEEPRSVWVQRLDAWQLEAPELRFRFADGTPWANLLREMDGLDLDLVLVDTLRAFAAIQDESDASKVIEAVQPLVFLARRKNFAAIITHHLRKSDADGGLAHSGSTALVAVSDVAVEMRLESDHAPNRRVLRAVSRFEETPRALTIELRGQDIVALGAPEAVTLNEVVARVQSVLRPDQGLTREAIREGLDDPQPALEQVSRALKTLLAEDKSQRTGRGVRGNPHLWWAKDSIPPRTPLRVAESNSGGNGQ